MIGSIFRRSYYPKKLSSYYIQSLWRAQPQAKTITATKRSECAPIRNHHHPLIAAKYIGTDSTSGSTSPDLVEHYEHPQEGITGKSNYVHVRNLCRIVS